MSSQSHVTIGATPQTSAGRLGDFSLLTNNPSLTTNNLGGKFALPREFDSGKYASGLYEEGQAVLAMEAPQPVIGTSFMSPGWAVWRYPKEVPTGIITAGKPVMQAHPMAGQPHKVAGTKPGENFVLMFRPLDVQAQVNAAYGQLSTEMMVQEVRGETNGVTQGDPGILTDSRLKREIGVDRQVEEDLNQGVQTSANLGPIRPQAQRISR